MDEHGGTHGGRRLDQPAIGDLGVDQGRLAGGRARQEGVKADLVEAAVPDWSVDPDLLVDSVNAWSIIEPCKFLSEHMILTCHHQLMQSRRTLEYWEKGRWRNCPVFIGGKEAPSAMKIFGLIKAWIEGVNKTVIDPLILKASVEAREAVCKHWHIKYEHIHPFIDGNGRTGRIFYNWQRLRLGLPIHIIWEKDKQEYYKWFQ